MTIELKKKISALMNKSIEDLSQINIDWKTLKMIHEDHSRKFEKLSSNAEYFVRELQRVPKVHSLKFRVKSPDHLIEKIVRKTFDEQRVEISLSNYTEVVTDLIGIRALHLFKEDWIHIHKFITENWDLKEDATANLKSGDNKFQFETNGCKIVETEHGYRSVHYLCTSKPSKGVEVVAEIQVRTLLEEAACEIDHTLRYPYRIEDPILSQYLSLYNCFAGTADLMGSFIRTLDEHIVDMKKQKDLELKNLNEEVEKLKKQIEKMDIKANDKNTLSNGLSILTSNRLGIANNDVISQLSEALKMGSQAIDWSQFRAPESFSFTNNDKSVGRSFGLSTDSPKNLSQGLSIDGTGIKVEYDKNNVLPMPSVVVKKKN